jgi:predicted transcriptional regulator
LTFLKGYAYNLTMTRKQIQRLIIQKGFTQTELAKEAGIPYPQILCSMLRGDRYGTKYRARVAKLLGINESELPRP